MNSQTKVTAFIVCLFILSLFSLPTQAYDTEQGTQNLLLTELDFDQAIKENQYVLVNFHALWCRYSKKLKPEWEKVSEHFKSSDVKIAKVEAYDEKKLAEQYEIDGFPTIKLFIDGQPHDYSGERTESHIIEFVNRKQKKELSSVSGKSDVDAKLKEYEWVGVYTSGNDNDAVKSVAFDFQDIYFVKSIASDVKQGASDGQFVLYSNITGDHVVFSGSMEEKDLRDFLNKNKFPSVAKFSKGTAEQIFLSEDPSLILIRDASADSDNAEKAFKDAKGLPDLTNVFMSVANTKDEISKLLAQNLGVSTNDLPAVVIVRADRERIRKYKMDDKKDITKDNVLSFYRDYKNKKAQRIYLSEEPPAENKDLVKKVVTKTFESMVLDKNTDVLLLIWAPWCGHCRAMMPVYDNVARKTREVPNFLVAKIDASVNDLEGFGLDIVEYPTILFFTRNNKADPIEFKGERNEYVFNEFIRSHAAVDLARMKGPNPFDKNEL